MRTSHRGHESQRRVPPPQEAVRDALTAAEQAGRPDLVDRLLERLAAVLRDAARR